MAKRELWIDLMRVFACLMVLFCHAPQPYTGQSGQFLMGVDTFFGMAWGPVLFFAISGACILGTEEDAFTFLKKRFSRVLIPTIVWSIIYIFVECFVWHTQPEDNWMKAIPSILISPQYGLMWFMYALASIYLMAPVFSKWLIHSSKNEVLLYICIWGLGLLIPLLGAFGCDVSSLMSVNGILYHFAGFLWMAVLGYYCRRYVAISKFKVWHFIAGVLILLGPLYIFLIKKFTGDNPGRSIINAFATLMAFLFFQNVRMPRFITEGKVKFAIEKLSALSFGIYLTHMLIMHPFRIWIAQYNLNYVVQIPITVVVVGIISVMIAWLVSKMPFGKFLIG